MHLQTKVVLLAHCTRMTNTQPASRASWSQALSVLLLAETSLCISALITHDLMKPLEDQINSNLYSEGIDTINVTNGTTTIKTLLFQNANNYSVSALIAETYPVEDAVAGLFEWFGLAIFLSGYMYFVIIALLEIFNDGTKKKYCSKQAWRNTPTNPSSSHRQVKPVML